MTTSIFISGQTKGNFALKSAIIDNKCVLKDRNFGRFELIFPTKKDANSALKNAYSILCEENEDYSGIKYSEVAGELFYDASKAVISENE